MIPLICTTGGTCPVIKSGAIGPCGGTLCTSDDDCKKLGQKCCDAACGGKMCTTPVYQTSPDPTSTTPTTSTAGTVMILSFRTNTSGQTVQTLIRLILEAQSDHGVFTVCNSICIFLTKCPKVLPLYLDFR